MMTIRQCLMALTLAVAAAQAAQAAPPTPKRPEFTPQEMATYEKLQALDRNGTPEQLSA